MSHQQLLSHCVTKPYIGFCSYFFILSAKLYFEERYVCMCIHTHIHTHTQKQNLYILNGLRSKNGFLFI